MMKSLSPQQALWLSLAAALATMATKAGAWWLTGSVGFLSDALESVVNLAGAGFALMMVRWASLPADPEHPFGHGKAEYFSAAFEAGLISLAALAILAAAGERLVNPRALEQLGMGTVLSVAASLINLLVARVLFSVGARHRSPALNADARHLMTDVWTTVGVLAGLGLAAATGWYWLDPVVAIAVALNILREGWALMRGSVDGLMDGALATHEIERIETMLKSFRDREVLFANLRTRSAGAVRFAHVDLFVPGHWTLTQAHQIADEIEAAARALHTELATHVEPLEEFPVNSSDQAADIDHQTPEASS